MIVRVVKRNVKKTDDLLNVWYPALPNKGKVRVEIQSNVSTTVFLDHYVTLNISLFIEFENNKLYLYRMIVNGNSTVLKPKLYLDEYVELKPKGG